MKFLRYSTIRISLDYDTIHGLETSEMIELRNKLNDIRSLRKLDLDASIMFNGDFDAVWKNNLESELISSLDPMIIKRRLKEREEKTSSNTV